MRLAHGVGGVDFQERIDYGRLRTDRLARVQEAIQTAGMAAVLLTKPENIRYATAVRGPAFTAQLRYVLLFAEGAPIVYELGDMLGHQRQHAPWIGEDNWRTAHSWLNGTVGQEATEAAAQLFARAIEEDLRARGAHDESVGYDALDEASRHALVSAGLTLVNANRPLLQMRTIKTVDEIACIRMSVAVAHAGFGAAYEAIRPGTREVDAGAAMYSAMLRAGAEVPSGSVRSGPNTFDVYHIGNTDRIIEHGDLVTVNTCSTTFNSYKGCIYRTFIAGRRPNEKEKDFYARCRDRVYGVIDEIRVGATTADAAKQLLPASTWGYAEEQALIVAEVGHGYGMGYEEPIISRIFSLDNPQTFEAGMIIAIECREGEPGYGGVRLEEMILVTPDGPELLTRWPSDEIVTAGLIE